VERLLNEPTAAALAYGIHELETETRFLVFDLGGGTFDVSVLELFEGVIEVRASTGDNHLGGEDFNQILINMFRAGIGAAWEEDRADQVLIERLREAAERARRGLTESSTVTMSVTWKEEQKEVEITAEGLEAQAQSLLERLREPVLRSLRDSNVRANDLGEIVLVGGGTRMPLVRRAVTKMFGRFPSNAVNPDEAVALGAAVQAGLKARDVALKEVVLTDVCPYSLGVDSGERRPDGTVRVGIFSPIIERNTAIPASRVQIYSTLQDGQKAIEFGIYQGESLNVADNIRLGQMVMKVPAARAGEIHVEVRFTYDINGLLEVDIHVPKTGERRELVIMDDETASMAGLEHRRAVLAALKQHPREADANKAALARAARCYEKFLGDTRSYISHITGQFEAVLDKQDPREVEHARAELMKALDQLEGETWL
ncbi:MAG: molecular chaperone HscC, partial [Caulobacter sp.]|nr:molecular chaperone HscC [Caulobacter sp.]